MKLDYSRLYNGLDTNVVLDLLPHTHGDTYDDGIIELLCVLSKNKNVFEIGTYRGRTTHNLALNANKVVTFDLGSNVSNDGYEDYTLGEIYKKHNHKNITQLVGDSLEFDFTPYYNQSDVVFLDGGHVYEVVKKDFKTSLKLLKDEGYIIIDDPNWGGVKKAITEFQSIYKIELINNIYFYKKI